MRVLEKSACFSAIVPKTPKRNSMQLTASIDAQERVRVDEGIDLIYSASNADIYFRDYFHLIPPKAYWEQPVPDAASTRFDTSSCSRRTVLSRGIRSPAIELPDL